MFSGKHVLRAGIILYGFRITFQTIYDVGLASIFVSVSIVLSIFLIGYIATKKVLKLDINITILTSAGSSICGAAAILASECLLKPEKYKTSVAITSVVVFGIFAMFLHHILYQSGWLNLSQSGTGIY